MYQILLKCYAFAVLLIYLTGSIGIVPMAIATSKQQLGQSDKTTDTHQHGQKVTIAKCLTAHSPSLPITCPTWLAAQLLSINVPVWAYSVIANAAKGISLPVWHQKPIIVSFCILFKSAIQVNAP